MYFSFMFINLMRNVKIKCSHKCFRSFFFCGKLKYSCQKLQCWISLWLHQREKIVVVDEITSSILVLSFLTFLSISLYLRQSSSLLFDVFHCAIITILNWKLCDICVLDSKSERTGEWKGAREETIEKENINFNNVKNQ
jgi:hypothetical protein